MSEMKDSCTNKVNEKIYKMTEENKKDRHSLRNEMNSQLWKLDDRVSEKDKEVALLNNSFEYMKEKVDSIETLLKDFIKSAPDKFATKQDHIDNREKINMLYKILWAVIAFVFTALWTVLLNVILNWGDWEVIDERLKKIENAILYEYEIVK